MLLIKQDLINQIEPSAEVVREQQDYIEYFDDGVGFTQPRIDMNFLVNLVVKVGHIQQFYYDNQPQIFGCTKGDDVAADKQDQEEQVDDEQFF